jgi:hypothetical protein
MGKMKAKAFSKILIFISGLLAILYLSTCTYLWARQRHFIFMPERVISQTPADYDLDYENVYLAADENGKRERIHAWWIPVGSPHPRGTLLYLHGSALNIGANVEHARRFHDLGLSVLLLSYRGYGRSDGDFPTETQIYADAEAGWDYLVNSRNVPPGRIIIYGHSLGGATGIDLALRHPETAGLIVEASFTSIRDVALLDPHYRLFPIGLILNQRFDSLSKVGSLRVPVLFLHGTADRFVPLWMSRELYENTASRKHLVSILGGGHNNSARIGGDHYLKAVDDFIQRSLEDAGRSN